MSEAKKHIREVDVSSEAFIDVRRPQEMEKIQGDVRRMLKASFAEFELDIDLLTIDIEHIEIQEELHPKICVFYGKHQLLSDRIDGYRPENLIDSNDVATAVTGVLHSLNTMLHAQSVFDRVFPDGGSEDYGVFELDSDTPETEKWDLVVLEDCIDKEEYSDWTPKEVQEVRMFLLRHAAEHKVYVINDQSRPSRVVARKFPLNNWNSLTDKEKRDEATKAICSCIHAENLENKNKIDITSLAPERKRPIGEWPVDYSSEDGMVEKGSMYRLNEEVKRILDADISKLTIFVDEDGTELAGGEYRYVVRLFLSDENFDRFMETEGSDFVDTAGHTLPTRDYLKGSEAGYDPLAFDKAMDESLEEDVQGMMQQLQNSFSSMDTALRFVSTDSAVKNLQEVGMNFCIQKEEDGFFDLDKMAYLKQRFSEYAEKDIVLVHCNPVVHTEKYKKGLEDLDTLRISLHRSYVESHHRSEEYVDTFVQLREEGASPIQKLDSYNYKLQYQMVNYMRQLLQSKDALKKERREELQHLWCMAQGTSVDTMCENTGLYVQKDHIFHKDVVDNKLLMEALEFSIEFRKKYPFAILSEVEDDGERPRLKMIGLNYR